MAIMNQFETASLSVPGYENGIMGLPHILINIAGVSFVIFSAILVVMSATFKAKQSQLVALGMLVFAGISSFTGGAAMFSASENLTRQSIEQSMERRSIEIDSEKLANIKSLQIDHNLTVEYIVSDEMRAEQYRYDYADNKKTYPDFEFNGDKLVDTALRELQIKGQTMGERLKGSRDKFSSPNSLWHAHKLRNVVAHEHDAEINFDQTRRALNGFKQALKDLGAI